MYSLIVQCNVYIFILFFNLGWREELLIFSVDLESKWLTGGGIHIHIHIHEGTLVGFCDNNAHPSSLAFLCLGLSNMFFLYRRFPTLLSLFLRRSQASERNKQTSWKINQAKVRFIHQFYLKSIKRSWEARTIHVK